MWLEENVCGSSVSRACLSRLILRDMGFLTWYIRVLTVLSISAVVTVVSGAANSSYCSNYSVSCSSQVNTLKTITVVADVHLD